MSYFPVALCCKDWNGYPCNDDFFTCRLRTSDTSIQTWGHWLQWDGAWSFSSDAPHWLQQWWYQRRQGMVFSLLYAEWVVILYYKYFRKQCQVNGQSRNIETKLLWWATLLLKKEIRAVRVRGTVRVERVNVTILCNAALMMAAIQLVRNSSNYYRVPYTVFIGSDTWNCPFYPVIPGNMLLQLSPFIHGYKCIHNVDRHDWLPNRWCVSGWWKHSHSWMWARYKWLVHSNNAKTMTHAFWMLIDNHFKPTEREQGNEDLHRDFLCVTKQSALPNSEHPGVRSNNYCDSYVMLFLSIIIHIGWREKSSDWYDI